MKRLFIPVIIVACVSSAFGQGFEPEPRWIEMLRSYTVIGSFALSALFFLLSLLSWGLGAMLRPRYDDDYHFERDTNRRRDEQKPPEMVAFQILDNYHRQALRELERNVAISNAISLLGIGIIFLGVLLALFGTVTMGVVSMASGVVIQIVNTLFNTQRDKSRTRVEKIENDMLQLKMADAMMDDKKRDAAIDRIISSYTIPVRQLNEAKVHEVKNRKIQLEN